MITNVADTENVLAAAYAHRKKVVLASSSEVYGKSTKVPLREDDNRVLGPTTIGSPWRRGCGGQSAGAEPTAFARSDVAPGSNVPSALAS
jgi:NAD-dependent epimerase/dehydratase family protein